MVGNADEGFPTCSLRRSHLSNQEPYGTNADHIQSQLHYDLIVVGSGPAGIHAAVQAAKLKRTVCIVERTRDRLGGSWVHTGTLPSKTMREALDSVQGLKRHIDSRWVERIMMDLPADRLLGRAREVSQQEEELIRRFLKKNKIVIINGNAYLEGAHEVRVNSETEPSFVIKGEKILIATGSRPRRPANIPFDGWRVVDSDEILGLECIPRSMVIFGAGIIGCEYACIFRSLGTEVTVVDRRNRIMQFMDQDVVLELKRIMEESGIVFLLDEDLQDIQVDGPKVRVKSSQQTLEVDVLFFAGGRTSNAEHMGLEKHGIQLGGRGEIKVNSSFQTKVPNIYAAGDVIGPPALAATSAHQGRIVSCHAFGAVFDTFPEVFPVGVYTIPELSSIGKTEAELQQSEVPYVVGRASYKEIARGHIRGETHGLIKILVHRTTHRILGIHIVGADAANLIHIGQAFMVKGGFAQDFINMIFNYPTLAEGYRIAAFNALNKIFPSGVIGCPPELQSAHAEESAHPARTPLAS